jgi:flagellar hook-associated protein 1 FlgK
VTRDQALLRQFPEHPGAHAQANQASLDDSYYAQISQIDNLLADTTSGLSPALQDFFKGVQDATANASSVASRQAMLSNGRNAGGALPGHERPPAGNPRRRQHQIDHQRHLINSYASQIAKPERPDRRPDHRQPGQSPNDLLDQRDQLVRIEQAGQGHRHAGR